jgi:hypothetical protein
MYKFRRKKKYRMGYNVISTYTTLIEVKYMAAATDYLRSIDRRTNWSWINSTFDIFSFYILLVSIFFLSIKFMSFASFIYYKKSLKNYKIYFNKILAFLCELRNHFISYHFLGDIGLLFSVNDEKNVYKKTVNYSLWFDLFL